MHQSFPLLFDRSIMLHNLTVKANASIVPSFVQSIKQPLHLTVKANASIVPSFVQSIKQTLQLTVKANASIVPSFVRSINQPLHLTVKAGAYILPHLMWRLMSLASFPHSGHTVLLLHGADWVSAHALFACFAASSSLLQ
jgi:hypothetical protein